MSLIDSVTMQRISTAHPKVRTELQEIYRKAAEALTSTRVLLRFSRVSSSFLEQAALYAQGRTAPGKIVTYAPAGLSYHNYGLAADIVILLDKDQNGTYETVSFDTAADNDRDGLADWMEVVHAFKDYGWEWGGDWRGKKDLPHFQKDFGRIQASTLLALHRSGMTDPDGYVLF